MHLREEETFRKQKNVELEEVIVGYRVKEVEVENNGEL